MVPALDLPEEEAIRVIETIASSGTFWIEWDQVKTILSVKLKQVLSDYPEAKMTTEQQSASLGETHQELVERLGEVELVDSSFDIGRTYLGLSFSKLDDNPVVSPRVFALDIECMLAWNILQLTDMTQCFLKTLSALLSFDEGPPFTLQRLCEILLSARSIYPKLSKLALALEKNLLVTSMLTSCSNQQMMIQDSDNPEKASEEGKLQSSLEQDGIDAVMRDTDETIAAVEEADVDEGISAEMDTFGEIGGPSDKSSSPPISS